MTAAPRDARHRRLPHGARPSRWRGASALLALLLAAACGPRGAAPTAPSEASPSPRPPSAQSEAQTSPPPRPAATCTGQPLRDHGFLPHDIVLAASVDLHAADLRQALRTLAARVQHPNHGLPISAGLVLAQLPLGLDLLLLATRDLDLDPAEALRVLGPEGRLGWVLATDCDTPELERRARQAWDLRITEDVGAHVGLPPNPDQFPHAVLFLGDGRLALVAPADAPRMRAWLTAAAPPPSPMAPPPPGALLDELEAAPVRVVFGGRGFVAGERPPPRALRVLNDRVVELP